jgi:hypothetical protein
MKRVTTKRNRSHVLLVGNGPNRATGNKSWAALLNDVARSVGGTPVTDDDYKTKPFPMLYERLLLEARRNCRWSETRLKEEIAREAKAIETRDLHRAVMELPFDEVMTTNYDQALEIGDRSLNQKPARPLLVREQRYSLFRHVLTADGRRLWYIHGDRREPTSILLGYDQYSGFLQQMRLYVTAGVQYKNARAGPVFRNRKRTSDQHSWVSRFFDADIWILGLGFDFVEIHLWWLLTYRARQHAVTRSSTNTIRYIFRPGEATAKLTLLEAFNVELVPIGGAATVWTTFYPKALRAIGNMLRLQ